MASADAHSLSKNDAEHIESHDEEKGGVRGRIHSVDDHRHHKHDKALDALGADGRVPMTDEESRMVCRKIDKHIMPILMWVYFLQILDKSCVGYGATFGMKTEAHLTDHNYSLISSAGYWAQLILCCGPTAFMIVRVPTRILLSTCLLCWGIAMLGLAFSKSWGPLLANRFLLGLFEAVAIPLFTVITTTWYRRREQPLRIAMWYGTNGVASMLGSLLTWALSFANTPHLYIYQILFLTVGLATVVTVPILYWRLDNNPAEARFLNAQERAWAIERLRDNNTGVQTQEFKWSQVFETFYSPQIIFYFLITFCVNTGASVTNTFGPLIIKGIFSTNGSTGMKLNREVILLNIPFGFVQTVVCFLGCILAARFGYKGFVLISFMLPCIIGSVLLFTLGHAAKDNGPRLFGYYLIAFLFGGNPLIFSWLAGNVGGYTKKSLAISMCNAGSAVGNIVGPFLFQTGAPYYHTGLGAVMGIFVACAGLAAGLVVLLHIMNKQKERIRVAHGKPAKIENHSMEKNYVQTTDENLGTQAYEDLTDLKNDEFVYTY